jgi:signal transduction histidine kinase
MKTEPNVIDESKRLNELHSFGILDTEEEDSFNDLMDIASIICGCPIATITFVDENRQWFKSKKNLPFRQTPRDISFCSHTISGNEVMIVEDAKNDARFKHSTLVTGPSAINFYAGAPIQTLSGYNIGTICVMDNFSRASLTPDQKNALQKIAKQINFLLELKKKTHAIITQAESLVEVEKQNLQLAKTEQQTERKYIAHELHENFAQTLAAVKLYIEFAEQDNDTSGLFIQKSKDYLEKIIKEIRTLSNSMVNSSLEGSTQIGEINSFFELEQKLTKV